MWPQQEHLQSRRWGLRVERKAGNTNMNSCFAIKKIDDTSFTPIWKRLLITKTFFPSIWIYYLIFTFELSYFQRISHKKPLPNIFLSWILERTHFCAFQAVVPPAPGRRSRGYPKRGKVVLSLKRKAGDPKLWDLRGRGLAQPWRGW